MTDRLTDAAVAAIQDNAQGERTRHIPNPHHPTRCDAIGCQSERLPCTWLTTLDDIDALLADRDALAAEVARLESNLNAVAEAVQVHFDRDAAARRADAERIAGLEGMIRRHEGWHDDEEGVWRCHWCHAEVDDIDTNYDGDDPVIPHTPDCEWVAALATAPEPPTEPTPGPA